MPADNSLSPKETLFVQAYLRDLNATNAARAVGYSPKNASVTAAKLLRRPRVSAAIAHAMEARRKELKIDADYVLRKLHEVAERCMQEVRPALDRRGKPITDEDGNVLYRFDSTGANRALELLGKHVNVGAYRDRVQVEGELTMVERLRKGRARIAGMIDVTPEPSPEDPATTEDELARRLEAGRERLGRGRPPGPMPLVEGGAIVTVKSERSK